MPELPEVEVVRRGIEDKIKGAQIGGVQVLHERTLRGQNPAYFQEFLQGWVIKEVVRRGKFIWITGVHPSQKEPSTTAILLHLGMSGQVLVRQGEACFGIGYEAPKHLRIELELHAQGAPDDNPQRAQFVDQRTFGRMHLVELVPTSDGYTGGFGSELPLIPAGLEQKIARDCLDQHLDLSAIVRRVRSSRRPIKTLLLDQQIVSGIGNIYADEGLFLAGVNPRWRGCSLSGAQIRVLYERCAEVMEFALAQGGTSFDALYVNTSGDPGYFARQLKVYGRRGYPCKVCGTELSQIQLGGRSATFCASCQVGPRSY